MIFLTQCVVCRFGTKAGQHLHRPGRCCTCRLRLLCSARRCQGLDGSSPLEKLPLDSSTGLAWCEWLELSRLPCWLCSEATSALPRCVL